MKKFTLVLAALSLAFGFVLIGGSESKAEEVEPVTQNSPGGGGGGGNQP